MPCHHLRGEAWRRQQGLAVLAGEHSHARGLAPPLLAAGMLACRFGTSFHLDKAPGLPLLLLLAMPSTGRAQAVRIESPKGASTCSVLPFHPFPSIPGRCAAAASADRSQGEPVAGEAEPSFHGRVQQALLQLQAPLRLLSSHFVPRVLLRHSLSPTGRNAVHMLCVSCSFPRPSGGWDPRSRRLPVFLLQGWLCAPPWVPWAAATSTALCLWGDLQWGWLLSTPSSQCYPCDVLLSSGSLPSPPHPHLSPCLCRGTEHALIAADRH